MNRTSNAPTEHFNALFPFPIKHSQGGLTAVFTREAESFRGKQITFVTTDSEPFQLAQASVVPAQQDNWTDADNRLLLSRWFGSNWTRLFVEATLIEMRHPGAADSIFPREDSEHEFGSLPYVLEYLERQEPDIEIERRFGGRFDVYIARILDQQAKNPDVQQVLNWQDACWFWGAIQQHADTLRNAGVFQTLHIHTSISPYLDQSLWGREVLKSMTLVDRLYLHSHRDMYNLEQQFRSNQMMAPEMEVYRLGIDTAAISKSLETVSSGNYASGGIPSFSSLTQSQQELIHKCFEAQDRGYVTFIIPERMEATKGTLTVYLAIEEALSQMDDETRSQVRFFFLQELRGLNADKGDNKASYLGYLHREDSRIKSKFPGNVFFAESLKQQQRVALFAMERGASFIGGGNAEGLGLAPLENAWLNRDHDTAIISGTGSGWAQEAISDGHACSFFGVSPGDVYEFARKILEVVRKKRENPGVLRSMKRNLSDWVGSRHDSVLVGRDN